MAAERKTSDISFRCRQILTSSRYHAARQAVLTPILTPSWIPDGVPAALRDVQHLWRRQVVRLYAQNWPYLQTDKALGYYRNCPPFGVWNDPPCRTCKRPLICPFCYARTFIIEPFKAFELALFGDLAKRKPLDPKLKLFEYTTKINFWRPGRPPVRTWHSADIKGAVRKMLMYARIDFRHEIETCRPLGGVVMQRVNPTKTQFQLVRSALLLGHELLEPATTLGDLDVRVHYPITRAALLQAFSRSCRFPAGVLRVHPSFLSYYLKQFRSTRMIERYGLLRGLAVDET